ncbi:restriction modification system DNA specificity subunit (plasmid) [Calothrix parasitica NIES-267]|uniref:Restriction modification system DNA specificity subunit n=1 Tax=Calothrix parasitica NIES-267 TaxID=1973488 RepID=A0A1Z4M3D1_9CYAN|nr:restriction modification system DNA specificity subunit [Calothrix parasitica NIES-267]
MIKKEYFDVEQLSSLPSNWCCTTLDELMNKIVDGTHHTPTYIEEGVPFLSVKDIRDGEIYFDSCKYISQEEHEELCKRCYPEYGDLLITKSGTIGRCAVVKTKRDFSLFVSVALLKPAIPEVNISYISLAFQSWFQNINVQNDITGTAIKNFHLVDFRRLALPIAPLNEQKRIVGKIEALQKRSQRVKEAIDAIPQLLDQFRQSVLAAAFRGDLTADWRENNTDVERASVLLEKIRTERRRKWEEAELEKMKAKGKVPKDDKWKQKYKEPEAVDDSELPELPDGWEWARVQEVGKVQLGRQRSPKNHSGSYMRPYLRAANVFEDRIDTSDVLEMNFDPREYEIFKLKSGDILLNEGQSKELVGRPAIYGGEVPGSCFQNTLVRFQVYQGLLTEYALVVFRGYMHNGRFQQIAQWTTNIAHLGAGRFAELEFPLPPEAEQIEIINRIKKQFEIIGRFEAIYKTIVKRSDQLNQSILAKAFRGELVPQNPNDEPASILLERIRAEREKLQQQTKAAKKSKSKTTKRRSKKAPQQAEEAIQLELPGMEE